MTLSLAVYWVDIIYDITAVSHLMDGIQIHMVSIGGSRIYSVSYGQKVKLDIYR